MYNISLVKGVVLAGITIVGTRYLLWSRRHKDLPPGPPKLPFIGNLYSMTNGLDWVRFSGMCQEYDTDILHLGGLGLSIVVLDTYDAAKELLERRAGIYSDRPPTTMVDLAGFNKVLTLLPYGDRWRAGRRIFAKHFGARAVKSIQSQQSEIVYARQFLKKLLDSPEGFLRHIQHLVGSVAISAAYGLKPTPKDDPNISAAEKLMKQLSDITDQGFFLVDLFPTLRFIPSWFPGATFQTIAHNCKQDMHIVRDGIFERAMNAMEENKDYLSSMVSHELQDLEAAGRQGPESIALLKDLAATVYLGAADTTWSLLSTFFLAMVCHPDAQKKAQQEIDNVLGGRLPEHRDLDQLPYLKAVLMEVMRWKPILPIGFVHVSTADDIYNGKQIPKGSLVFFNTWAMANDPFVYPNPSEFRPERFMKDGNIDPSVRNPLDFVFGFGRRICPGRHTAQSTFMITAASVLSTFDLLMQRGEAGGPIHPKQEFHISLICHPKEFPCRIEPRTPQAKQLTEMWNALVGKPGGA